MLGNNLSGLIELLFVVGLLLWFWKSQTSPSARGEELDQGKRDVSGPGNGEGPPPPT